MDKVIEEVEQKLELFWESKRLTTFQNWPLEKSKTCSSLKMAEAGFYYIGSNKSNSDAVKCFLCNKELDDWDKNDNAWKEHASHSPNCTFASIGRPEKELIQKQIYDLKLELIKKIFAQTRENVISMKLEEYSEAIKTFKKRR